MEQQTTKTTEKIRFADILTKPEQGHAMLLGIFCFLSCLILPLANTPSLPSLYLVSVIVFFYLLTRSIRAMLYYALPAMLLFLASGIFPTLPTALLPTYFVALVLGGATGGFVLIHYHDLKKYPYVLAIPMGAYALAALITGNPLVALLSLLPFALSAVAALCVLLLVKRTDATLILAGTLAVTLAAAGALACAVSGVEGSPLTFLADTVRGGIHSLLAQMEGVYAEAGMTLGMSEIAVSNAATLLVNLLPGLYLAACSITAFLALRLLLQFLIAFRSVPHLPVRLGGFTVSRVSAVVFIATYLLSLFTNYSTATLFGTVCSNLALALEPGLALVGVSALLPRGNARSCLSTLLLTVMLVLAVTDPLLGLELAALTGAVCVLTARLMRSPDQDNKGVK